MHTRRYSSNNVPDPSSMLVEIELVHLTWPAPLVEGLHIGAVIEHGTVLRVSEESISRIY